MLHICFQNAVMINFTNEIDNGKERWYTYKESEIQSYLKFLKKRLLLRQIRKKRGK